MLWSSRSQVSFLPTKLLPPQWERGGKPEWICSTWINPKCMWHYTNLTAYITNRIKWESRTWTAGIRLSLTSIQREWKQSKKGEWERGKKDQRYWQSWIILCPRWYQTRMYHQPPFTFELTHSTYSFLPAYSCFRSKWVLVHSKELLPSHNKCMSWIRCVWV